MKNVSPTRLRELLEYNTTTGQLFWRVDRGKVKAGKEITCLNGAGYIVVRVDDVLLRAHRAIWAMIYDEWPNTEIDHINGVRCDNRLENLRQATHTENMKNIKKPATNRSGFKGVSWHYKGQKWQAHIKADGVNHYLGLFDTAEQAHEAYKEASQKLHGLFGKY